MMPGKHGGQLRRGGGRPPVSKAKAEALTFLRDHALDAARALVVKALRGDTRAQELVLAYSIGKPVDKLELTGEDGGPVRFMDGLDDHERAALKEAIDAQLAVRAEVNGRTRTDQAPVPVEGAPS
jgi:hypothetical protein